MSKEVLLSKFKGALVGAVLGDCIGAVFECLWASSNAVEKVLKSIDELESDYDPKTGNVTQTLSLTNPGRDFRNY